MRNKRQAIRLSVVIALALLCLGFLLAKVLVSAKRDQAAPSPAGAVQPILAETNPPVLDTGEESLPAAIEEYTHTAVEAAYTVAGLYQDLYDALYSDGGLILRTEDSAQIIQRLGDQGYIAADINDKVPMTRPEDLAGILAGEEGHTAIYELCLDAGFICHTLHCHEGKYYLTRTRLAWLANAGSGLQGSTATVTYSNSFQLTGLYMDGEYLYYDYEVPNNLPGTSHDGHIDTFTAIYTGHA